MLHVHRGIVFVKEGSGHAKMSYAVAEQTRNHIHNLHPMSLVDLFLVLRSPSEGVLGAYSVRGPKTQHKLSAFRPSWASKD